MVEVDVDADVVVDDIRLNLRRGLLLPKPTDKRLPTIVTAARMPEGD